MHRDDKTREEARASLFEYMEVFYNRPRRHSTIGLGSAATLRSINRWSSQSVHGSWVRSFAEQWCFCGTKTKGLAEANPLILLVGLP